MSDVRYQISGVRFQISDFRLRMDTCSTNAEEVSTTVSAKDINKNRENDISEHRYLWILPALKQDRCLPPSSLRI